MGELSLVEHSLCPLDSGRSLAGPLRHRARYWYFDRHRNRKQATAETKAVDGLSANDEFYLWGILGLVFSQPQPSVNFYATRNYILRQLGIAVGGENYLLLHASLRRLAGVRYSNDRFFDPMRGEHRQVSFGFLSFSIPADARSMRAWHIAIDPIFFSMVEPVRAHFWFDLEAYRKLDTASRRLFLLLKKVFYRASYSPRWELEHLAVDVLGYAQLERKFLKRKVRRCAEQLAAQGIITSSGDVIEKRGDRLFARFERGPFFNAKRNDSRTMPLEELPVFEQWTAIGVDRDGMGYLRRTFSMELLQQWADITLAAKERHGHSFFDRSMAAYYIDNVKAASKEGRRPPDWWHDFKKQELNAVSISELTPAVPNRAPSRREYLAWLKSDGRTLYEATLRDLFDSVQIEGRASPAVASAVRQKADGILWNEFLATSRLVPRKKID